MKSEEILNSVVEFIQERNERFNAPYGIIHGESKDSKGRKVQKVVFGIARYLDCEIVIYSEKFILVRSSRHGNRAYRTLDEFWVFMKEEL
jgi:hypothetical protein